FEKGKAETAFYSESRVDPTGVIEWSIVLSHDVLLKSAHDASRSANKTVETSSKEHLPLSACLTYFPSFCAPCLPLHVSGYRGQPLSPVCSPRPAQSLSLAALSAGS
ncbi:unnamed protein product, partial [Pleuronectes platessa]